MMTNYPALYLATLTSQKGRASMQRLLNRLPEHNSGQPVDWTGITPSQVVMMIASMEDKGLSVSTLNTALSAIKGVCHAAWREHALSDESYSRIKDIKQKKQSKLPTGRAITYDEVQSLLSTCLQDKNQTKGCRDAAIITLGVYVGLRRSEIADLKAKRIDLENMTIRVLGKGNKEEVLPLPESIKQYLIPWLNMRTQSITDQHLTGIYLFGAISKSGKLLNLDGISDKQVWEVLKQRSLAAGIDVDNLPTPHDMRRTRATTLLDAGVHPRIAQKMMRHANVETTMRYDRGNIDDALREAVNHVD
ncbi:MAG: tyrosine-type recombinase/integrase [Gammaproteobacteria bacterium]|nr:tyrosine-type recombinase/integrase [Gammaproteobacteria bacterium]